MSRPGEFDLIARYFAPLAAAAPGAFGLRDDAAVLAGGPGEIAVTTDMLVADVHFRRADPPETIARKALRVNLSDLAAMGADPFAYTLAIALPDWVDEPWLAAFASALGDDQRTFGAVLVGGDTVGAGEGPLTLSITALGRLAPGAAVRRGGAKPGDRVYVTGTIGDAALGLLALQGGLGGLDATAQAALIARYRVPEPRVSFGRALGMPALRPLIGAAIDVSDGLVADLGHICEVSGVSAVIAAERVPLAPAARAALEAEPRLIERVLTGGDDYELILTVAPAGAAAIERAAGAAGTPLTAIGEIVAATSERVRAVGRDGAGLALARTGFRHF